MADGEATYISLNIPNIITISLCGALGFGLLLAATLAFKKMTGRG